MMMDTSDLKPWHAQELRQHTSTGPICQMEVQVGALLESSGSVQCDPETLNQYFFERPIYSWRIGMWKKYL